MSKKAISSVVFVVISFGICLLIANAYLKRIEIGAIQRYLGALQGELRAHNIELDFEKITCTGFIKHRCESREIRAESASFGDSNVILRDISLAITSLHPQNVALSAKVGDISQNLILLPKNFTYNLSIKKVDSALGYIVLNRGFDFSIGNIAGRVNMAVLVRDKRMRNKSIFFLLKEWFDAKSASFYEYSLESLDVSLEAKRTLDSAFLKQNQQKIEDYLALLNSQNPRFAELTSAIKQMLRGEIKKLDFSASRKNVNLPFFHSLSPSATKEKALEIKEILQSIDESYALDLVAK